MRKYGVNWLLWIVGVLVSIGTVLLFWNYVFELMYPSPRTESVLVRTAGQTAGALLQAGIWFSTTRSQAKERQQAEQATEDKPFVGQIETDIVSREPVRFFTPWSRKMFGFLCTLSAILSVYAHVRTGSIGVVQVVGFTLGVPLCFVFGMYLMAKARETKTTEREEVLTVGQAVPLLPVTLPQTEDADTVPLSRMR